MCSELERCGQWDCRIGDFMCPRHEFNKMDIPQRGLGDCSAAPISLRELASFATSISLWLTISFGVILVFVYERV